MTSINAVSSATQGTSHAGSTAQTAYERAVKTLAAAQQKLTQDTTAKASEKTLQADQAAIQVAQIAVQTAADAVTREGRESTSAQAPATTASRDHRLDVEA